MSKWKRRRAGRKRKIDAERYDCGKIAVPSGPDMGTEEQRAIRQSTTGAADLSPDYPLHILHGRKFLVPLVQDGKRISEDEALQESRALVSAGMAHAARYWRLFGRPFAKGMNYERFLASDRGAAWDDPVQRLRDERQYAADVDALLKIGALAVVNRYAVWLERDWYVSDIANGAVRVNRHHRRRDLLLAGLRALASAPRVRLTDDEILRAQKEAA